MNLFHLRCLHKIASLTLAAAPLLYREIQESENADLQIQEPFHPRCYRATEWLSTDLPPNSMEIVELSLIGLD